MAGIKVKGLDELIKKVESMGKESEESVKRALYSGAGIMTDAIRSAVSSLPIDESFGTTKHKKRGITRIEKSGLLSGLGISHMIEANNNIYVFIGFAWSNNKKVKNTTIMRAVESGTSIMQKIPTIRPTKNRTKAAAITAMQKQFEEDLQKMMG